MKTLKLFKAAAGEYPTQPIKIIIKRPIEDIPVKSVNVIYSGESLLLEAFLHETLPGGTYSALFQRMAERVNHIPLDHG
jgi:hypothetical protein